MSRYAYRRRQEIYYSTLRVRYDSVNMGGERMGEMRGERLVVRSRVRAEARVRVRVMVRVRVRMRATFTVLAMGRGRCRIACEHDYRLDVSDGEEVVG